MPGPALTLWKLWEFVAYDLVKVGNGSGAARSVMLKRLYTGCPTIETNDDNTGATSSQSRTRTCKPSLETSAATSEFSQRPRACQVDSTQNGKKVWKGKCLQRWTKERTLVTVEVLVVGGRENAIDKLGNRVPCLCCTRRAVRAKLWARHVLLLQGFLWFRIRGLLLLLLRPSCPAGVPRVSLFHCSFFFLIFLFSFSCFFFLPFFLGFILFSCFCVFSFRFFFLFRCFSMGFSFFSSVFFKRPSRRQNWKTSSRSSSCKK